jgi:hypothetical protein
MGCRTHPHDSLCRLEGQNVGLRPMGDTGFVACFPKGTSDLFRVKGEIEPLKAYMLKGFQELPINHISIDTKSGFRNP